MLAHLKTINRGRHSDRAFNKKCQIGKIAGFQKRFKARDKMLEILFNLRVEFRDGHTDEDKMPIRNMRHIYRAISDICRIIYPHGHP